MKVDEYIEKYGTELGETLFHVHVQWCRLFSVFSQYSNLFGKSKERVDLLNQSAGPFFKNVQDTFHDETLLGICRLTDPAQSKKKKNPNRNVSVLRLALLLKEDDTDFQIEKLAIIAKDTAEFARNQRDKRISHFDLDVATKRSKLVGGASIVQMRLAIKAIHNVVFAIGQKIGNVHYVSSVIGTRSEFSLLKLLYEAQQGNEELQAKILAEMKQDYRSKFYPGWLFDEDEETKWR